MDGQDCAGACVRERPVLPPLLQAYEAFYDGFPYLRARDLSSDTLGRSARLRLGVIPGNSGDDFAGLALENLVVAGSRHDSCFAEPGRVTEGLLHTLGQLPDERRLVDSGFDGLWRVDWVVEGELGAIDLLWHILQQLLLTVALQVEVQKSLRVLSAHHEILFSRLLGQEREPISPTGGRRLVGIFLLWTPASTWHYKP